MTFGCAVVSSSGACAEVHRGRQSVHDCCRHFPFQRDHCALQLRDTTVNIETHVETTRQLSETVYRSFSTIILFSAVVFFVCLKVQYLHPWTFYVGLSRIDRIDNLPLNSMHQTYTEQYWSTWLLPARSRLQLPWQRPCLSIYYLKSAVYRWAMSWGPPSWLAETSKKVTQFRTHNVANNLFISLLISDGRLAAVSSWVGNGNGERASANIRRHSSTIGRAATKCNN